MTANTVTTRELPISRIIKLAFHHAGQTNEYMTLDVQQTSLAEDLLETIVDELQASGYLLRATRPDLLVTLVAGTTVYELPATVLTVTGTAMYIAAGQDVDAASGETPVRPISTEEWQTISSKDAESSHPTMYLQQRIATGAQVVFWPIPSEAGTVRFQANYLLGDNNDSTKTPDLERPCTQFLIWELAHQIAVAKSMPTGRCMYLSGQAEKKRALIKLATSATTGFQVRIGHRTPWS